MKVFIIEGLFFYIWANSTGFKAAENVTQESISIATKILHTIIRSPNPGK